MECSTLQESELQQWFDHLAQVFENTGRDYFVRHWNNDPNASFSDIFVARDPASKKIASTVKVYKREFYFDGKILKVGGIGEVSTKPEYRSQGLAHKLLDLTLPLMIGYGITVSALSASKARPYYEKLGWRVIPYNVASQQINAEKLLQRNTENKNIKLADFSEAQVAQLIPLHHYYAQHFNGPLCRNNQKYWREWIKSESGENAWVLEDESGAVRAFVCFGVPSPKVVVVKDFCVGETEWQKDKGRATLQQFVENFVRCKQKEIGVVDQKESLELKYPKAIMGENGKLYEDENVEIERKETFLYRVFGGSIPSETFMQQMASSFVYWDVDKF